MKSLLLLLFVFAISSKASSQVLVSDSSIYLFKVQSIQTGNENPCNPGPPISQKFNVLSSNFKLPVGTIFISKQYLTANITRPNTILTLRGYVLFKKDWTYGCFSSRWEETRMYVTPLYLAPYFKPQDPEISNH